MKKYSYVMQDSNMDCGISCLLMIIRYYSGNISKEYLRELTNTSKNGTNAYYLIGAGRKLGFDTKGVTGDVLDIEDKNLPCIAHVKLDLKYNHFVVIYEIDKKNKHIILADPSRGIIKMDYETFKNISTGNYLFFTPIYQIPLILSDNKLKYTLTTFIYNNRKQIISIIIVSILFTLLNIVTSYNFQFIIDKALTYFSKYNLIYILSIMTIIYFLKDVMLYLRNIMINFINHKLDYILVKEVFSHIMSLPLIYYRSRTVGDVTSRMSDLSLVRDSISSVIITVGTDLILLVFVLIFLFLLNIKITLIVIVIMVIYYYVVRYFNNYIEYYLKDIKEKESGIKTKMIEMITGVGTLKSMNVIPLSLENFKYKYDSMLTTSYSFSKVVCFQKLCSDILISVLLLVVIFYGSYLTLENSFTLSKLVTYNSLILYFLEPIKNIINFDSVIKKSKVIAGRINELLAIDKENILLDMNDLKRVDGDIEIKKLSYSYGNNEVLKNLSVKIKKGEKIVVCAPSGFGKSTLANILSRYIKVEKGIVKIGDIDINDYNLWLFREDVTYVSQDEYLFTDTLLNNVDIRNTRDLTRITKVLDITGVNEILNKKSLDNSMYLFENGANLSGGERERVILARTFLKESNIYILDETFSEMDVECERKILMNLFTEFKSKTIIVISHRFDNNDLYDKVLNLGG